MGASRLTSEARRRAIIEVALPLFAQKGFAKTTTRDIAKAAGVSEPLLYKHFPSKEALYSAIQDFGCAENDPICQKLGSLQPSTSTLVHLVYFLMRNLILQNSKSCVSWNMRYRLMVNSFLEDGTYAAVMHKNRFDPFCSRIEACIKAAIAAGDIVSSPVGNGNSARFTHHIAAWIGMAALPAKPVLDYKVKPEKLLEQSVWFALRGMGMSDKAIKAHFHPKTLDLFFA